MNWRLYLDLNYENVRWAARADGQWRSNGSLDWQVAEAQTTLDPSIFMVGRILAECKKQGLSAQACDGVLQADRSGRAAGVPPALRGGLKCPVRFLENETIEMKGAALTDEFAIERVTLALAAYHLHGGPVIALEMDDLVATSVVSADGTYLGGHVGPGSTATWEGMTEVNPGLIEAYDAPLPPGPPSMMGRTTAEAMRMGLVLVIRTLALSFTGICRSSLGVPDALVVITGSEAEFNRDTVPGPVCVNPLLMFEGMRLIDGYE